MSDYQDLSDSELITRYERIKAEKQEVFRNHEKVREEMMKRIRESESEAIYGRFGSHYVINTVSGLRVKGLKDIEDNLGREWLNENRNAITQDTTSYRLKKVHD